MAQVKERRGGREERKETFSFFPLPLPPLLFFGSHGLISRAIKTETPLPRSLFAPKANGNACYAGYIKKDKGLDLGAEPPRIKLCWVPPHPPPPGRGLTLFQKIRKEEWQSGSYIIKTCVVPNKYGRNSKAMTTVVCKIHARDKHISKVLYLGRFSLS